MKRLARLACTILLVATAGAPAVAADFAEGLRAFDAGDYATAFAEWLPLAEAGDVQAQIALAGLYESGHGVPASAREAAKWYRRAAEQGDAVAQMNLGDMYARGRGVPRDPVAAYVWLTLAADQGQSWAAERRIEVAATLSAGQKAAAEAELRRRRAAR